jgi:hypothetical protein
MDEYKRMTEKEFVFNYMRGRPSGSQLREHFMKIDVKEIDEGCIGKECVIIYVYSQMISGNYHKDVLYHGILTEVSDRLICISDKKWKMGGRISRSRCQRFEFFVRRPS